MSLPLPALEDLSASLAFDGGDLTTGPTTTASGASLTLAPASRGLPSWVLYVGLGLAAAYLLKGHFPKQKSKKRRK